MGEKRRAEKEIIQLNQSKRVASSNTGNEGACGILSGCGTTPVMSKPSQASIMHLLEEVGYCEGSWTEVVEAASLLPNAQALICFPLALIPSAFAV